MLNDCLQGSAEGVGFLYGGTPEFLTDTRRGLYSYEALQTRLSENKFAVDGVVDFSGPVIRLANLTPEDMYILLTNLRRVFASGNDEENLLPDEAIQSFMRHCSERIGDAYFRTPRNTVREFVHLLSALEQNPGLAWDDLLQKINIEEGENPDSIPEPEDAGETTKTESGSSNSKQDEDEDDDLANLTI